MEFQNIEIQEHANLENVYEMYKKSARKKARNESHYGLRRSTKFRTNNRTDPSRGGSAGYDLWYRIQVMHHVYAFGHEDAVEHFGICRRTLYNWNRSIFPKLNTGNGERKNLVGRDQLLLSIALFQRPTSTADEIALFIYTNGGAMYSRQQIYKRLHELQVTRKRASVETYDAYTPLNLVKAFLYWTQGPRVGILGVDRKRMIDIDECHFTLKSIGKTYGYAAKPCRVRDLGHFKKGRGSINLIIAIEPGDPTLPDHVLGSVSRPRRWFRITRNTNVDQHIFANFIDEICTSIETNPKPVDNERFFLWDNLTAHGTALVYNTLEMRETRDEHRFVSIPRPPYRPRFAPIEYIICQIATELSLRTHRDWTLDTLEAEVHNVCLTVGNDGVADRTWHHIGYE